MPSQDLGLNDPITIVSGNQESRREGEGVTTRWVRFEPNETWDRVADGDCVRINDVVTFGSYPPWRAEEEFPDPYDTLRALDWLPNYAPTAFIIAGLRGAAVRSIKIDFPHAQIFRRNYTPEELNREPPSVFTSSQAKQPRRLPMNPIFSERMPLL